MASSAVDPADPAREDPTPAPGVTGRELALIFVFWTFLALLISANRLTDPRLDRQAIPLTGPIVLTLVEAYLWAALTPVIFWVASRLSPTGRRWLWAAPLLLLGGVVLAAGVSTATTLLRDAVLPRPRWRTSPAPLIDRFAFLNDFIMYLGVLAAGFARDYFRRYQAHTREADRLHAEAAALRAQLAEAQLSALRMQLNPHFLFNTLHAVSALVGRDPAGVRRMIARLSELLRSTLEEGAQPERTLDRELAFLSRYLEIMQVRFQGKLEVSIEADASARAALVPTLILQPLVENAVKHGLGEGGGGSVSVRARHEGARLRLSVHDSGPGPRRASAPSTEGGLGLRNTEARLRAFYGDAQRLSLAAAEGGGTVAEIEMPYRPSPEAPATPSESALIPAGAARE